ncbi:MAG: BF3164 family lipoprotein [Marinifilaceae bacterium]
MRIYLCILVLFCISCNFKLRDCKEINIENVNCVDTLNYSSEKSVELLYPSRINIVDQFLIITNEKNTSFFDVYDLSSMEKIISFGKKGKGPREYLMPSIYATQIVNDSAFLCVFDVLKRIDCRINLSGVIKNCNLLPTIEKLPNKLGIPEKIIYKSTDTIIFSPDSDMDHARFCIYSYETNKKLQIKYLPELDYDISKINCYPIYNNVSSCYSDSLGVFAATSVMLGQVDFFRKNGQYLYSSVIERQEKLKYGSENHLIFRHSPTRYHTDLRDYDGYVYLLYSKINGEGQVSNSEIYKLDWKGKVIKKIVMNKVCVSFDISEKDGCLYAVTYDNFNYSVIKCNLSNEKL